MLFIYNFTPTEFNSFISFQKLQDLDDDLKEKYLELITRFYLLFENIYLYIVDLNSFVDQLHEGVFIQQSIETIMRDVEGKQLLVTTFLAFPLNILLVPTFKIRKEACDTLG